MLETKAMGRGTITPVKTLLKPSKLFGSMIKTVPPDSICKDYTLLTLVIGAAIFGAARIEALGEGNTLKDFLKQPDSN
jgi:hypothetical protein